MKKYSLLFLVLSCFFVNLKLVNADCEDLVKEVNKVKVFNESVAPKDDSKNPKMGINIQNLTEDMYVVITNSQNDKSLTVKYEDTDNGSYWFKSPNVYKNVKVTVKVYSNDSNVCSATDTIKTFEATTDIFNQYYYTNICQNNLDLDECKPFVSNEGIERNEFKDKIDKSIEIRDMTFLDKLWEFVKKYYLYALVPVILLSIVFIIRIVILKRGKKNEEV